MFLTLRRQLQLITPLLVLASSLVIAQDEEAYELTAEEQQQLQHYQAILESLNPQTGEI